MDISDFYCTKCGNRGISFFRTRQREAGHLKKLYCPHCKTEHNHVEIRPVGRYTLNDFYTEFYNGNFENGVRIIPLNRYGEIRQCLREN